MPYRIEYQGKARTDYPFKQPLKRDIIIQAGAKWPTGVGSDYLLPLGIPLAPEGTTGRYIPKARTTIVTALASSAETVYLKSTDGFSVGDVIALYTAAATTAVYTAPILAIDRTSNYIKIADDILNAAATNLVTNSYVAIEKVAFVTTDQVLLGENVETADVISGTTFPAPTVGIIGGQVEIAALADNCYDGLTKANLPRFDFIPATPGV